MAFAHVARKGVQTPDAVSLSVGASLYTTPALTLEELMAAADAALYDAKRAGRDRLIEPGLAQVTGNGRPVEVFPWIEIGPAVHDLGHQCPHEAGHVGAVTAVTHAIEHAITLSGARQAVHRHVDHAAPAVVDADLGQLREHLQHLAAQDLAAPGVGLRIGHSEARAPAEEQAIARCRPEIIYKILGVGVHAPRRQQLRQQLLRQGFGDDQESADRHDAAAYPAKRTDLGNTAGQQHVACAQAACRRLHLIAAPLRLQAQHGSVFEVDRTAPLGGVGQATHITADVHAGALFHQQSTVVTVAAQFVTQLGAGDQARVCIDVGGQQGLAARQLVDVLGLGRQLELAVACKTAVDGFLAHQPFHRIDTGIEGAIEPVGPLRSQAL
ncbi:hypothetical protein Lal_00007074 [Lupinus albus]|nr:hypothetical protein Lal_00007074 [Lupinus albus]